MPVKRPDKTVFFRCHPSPDYQGVFSILKLEDREFLVLPEMVSLLPGDVTNRLLRTCITRQGNMLIWPIGVPDEQGRDNSWHASARDAAEEAETQWIRILANREAGGYDVFAVSASVPNPDWPDIPFNDILRTAFNNDGLIDREDHPALRRLRGEI